MAFYIELDKIFQEDENYVYYSYKFSLPGAGGEYKTPNGRIRYLSKKVVGKLKLNKKNGDIEVLELAEGDKGMYVQRACWALSDHWQKGEFPDQTCWAS
jgi:hypothetical protein